MTSQDFYKGMNGDRIHDVYIIGVTHNFGSIENVKSEWLAHEGEHRLLTHWKDRLGNEHNDLTLAKNNIDRRAARKLLKKYNQEAGLILKPDGTFDFLLIEHKVGKNRATKMDEVIKLDWGKFWPGCMRKKEMSIRSLLAIQRWGLSLTILPEEVQEKCDEAIDECSLSLDEYMQCYVGDEQIDESGKKYICLTPINESQRGLNVEKKIYALSEVEEDYNVIGRPEGQSFEHCVYLGFRYSRIFLERVCAYKIGTPKMQDMKIAVTFYEKKPN